jgi:hypothetical protein
MGLFVGGCSGDMVCAWRICDSRHLGIALVSRRTQGLVSSRSSLLLKTLRVTEVDDFV